MQQDGYLQLNGNKCVTFSVYPGRFFYISLRVHKSTLNLPTCTGALVYTHECIEST